MTKNDKVLVVFMLLAYGARNCWCFKDWLNIDLRLNGNVPKEYGFDVKPVAPTMCFEGANASGKSSALRVLSFIKEFCLNSFSYNPTYEIPYETYFGNQEESELYLDFSIPSDLKTVYEYQLTMTKLNVVSEKLESQTEKTSKVLFLREGNSIKINNLYKNIRGVILKNNSSFISTFVQYGIPGMNIFFDFFNGIYSNVNYYDLFGTIPVDCAEFYVKKPELFDEVKNELKRFDTGIEEVKISSYQDDKGLQRHTSFFGHLTEQGIKPLNFVFQSTGTKVLYNRLADFLSVLKEGGILIYDELDCHLHSDLVKELINYFLDSKNNPNHAQLLFTSHDSNSLDDMKKYRSYIFNKEHGECFAYRCDELKANSLLRNDRSLTEVYNAGHLGGHPHVQEKV